VYLHTLRVQPPKWLLQIGGGAQGGHCSSMLHRRTRLSQVPLILYFFSLLHQSNIIYQSSTFLSVLFNQCHIIHVMRYRPLAFTSIFQGVNLLTLYVMWLWYTEKEITQFSPLSVTLATLQGEKIIKIQGRICMQMQKL